MHEQIGALEELSVAKCPPNPSTGSERDRIEYFFQQTLSVGKPRLTVLKLGVRFLLTGTAFNWLAAVLPQLKTFWISQPILGTERLATLVALLPSTKLRVNNLLLHGANLSVEHIQRIATIFPEVKYFRYIFATVGTPSELKPGAAFSPNTWQNHYSPRLIQLHNELNGSLGEKAARWPRHAFSVQHYILLKDKKTRKYANMYALTENGIEGTSRCNCDDCVEGWPFGFF